MTERPSFLPPSIEQTLPGERRRYEAVTRILTDAEECMRAEHSEKPFHNVEHPRTMRERAERLCTIFELTPERRQLVDIAIAYHDVDINVEQPPREKIDGMIKRSRGAKIGDVSHGVEGNEALSAKRAAEAMREANTDADEELFSPDQIATVIEAIHATYPAVDFVKDFPKTATNAEIQTALTALAKIGVEKGIHFFQPHLENPLEKKEPVSLETIVVALTDIAHPGIEAPAEFEQQGDAEFRELLPNISLHLPRLTSGESEQDQADRTSAADKMLGWLKDQRGFVMWQMLRFEKIVTLLQQQEYLDEAQEQQLRQVFGHFSENVHAAIAREENVSAAYARKKASDERSAFIYLATELGYRIGVDVQDPKLPDEIKFEATTVALERFRTIVRDTDTVVFGSTAKYLHGKSFDLQALTERPPGDFDAALPSEEALRNLCQRLLQIPDVILEDGGNITILPDGAKRLSGHLLIRIQSGSPSAQIIRYPFEFFAHSTIVTDELRQQTTSLHGFNVLNREALEKQHLRIQERESRIDAEVERIVKKMNDPEKRAAAEHAQKTGDTLDWIKDLSISPDDLIRFYVIEDQLRDNPDMPNIRRETLRAERGEILSGIRTKLAHRNQSLQELGL